MKLGNKIPSYTFLILLFYTFIDFPEDKDNSSISFINLNTFSYDRSMFFIIYSDTFGLMSICLSEKYFDIITSNSSSVGNSIPKLVKLSILDFRSPKVYFELLIGCKELTTTYFSFCFD